MKVLLVAPVLAGVLLLAGCGGGSSVARDPGGSASPTGSVSPSPTQPPEGPSAPLPTYLVRTAGLVTVMDIGQGPEVCFGPVAESDPPQCTGPAVRHWHWDSLKQGMFNEEGSVRWGLFQLTGSWDGTAFTVDSEVPGAVYDPGVEPSTPVPAPAVSNSADRLQQIADELQGLLPGFVMASPDEAGHVRAEVVYDDGSLQRWADRRYGRHVVVVTSALIQLGRA